MFLSKTFDKVKNILDYAEDKLSNAESIVQNTTKYKAICYAVIVLAIFYAVVRGLTIPEIQWDIGYYFTSVFDHAYRRTFFGTVLSFMDLRYNIYFIIGLIYIITFTLIAGFMIAIRNHVLLGTLFIVLFFMSFYGPSVLSFFIIGSPEYFQYILLIVALYFNRLWLYVFLVIISLWTHEVAFFTTIPIICMHLWFEKRYKDIAIICICSIAIMIFLAFNTKQIHADYVKLYYKTLKINFDAVSPYFWIIQDATLKFKNYHTMFPGNVSPYAFWGYLLSFAYFLFVPKITLIKKCVVIGAIFSSLFLGFIAWDTYRWDIIFIINMLLALFFLRPYIHKVQTIIFLIAYLFIATVGKQGAIWKEITPFDKQSIFATKNAAISVYKYFNFFSDEHHIKNPDNGEIKIDLAKNYKISYPAEGRYSIECDGFYNATLFNGDKIVYDKLRSPATRRYIEPETFTHAYITPFYKVTKCFFENGKRNYKDTQLNIYKKVGDVWNGKGNTVIPRILILKFDKIQKSKKIDVSYDWNDEYTFTFKYKGKTVGEKEARRFKKGNGLALDRLTFDKAITFDTVEIIPRHGDRSYSIGHFIPK